ncbi:signal peptidase I [Cellulosimicrobium cellulans]|uniref:signal peptidase I n=1 Tax=Cellulosimicrobium cellulans TaxID=1710 RepID=UPI00130D7E95|nr:signal peptidase I [Cellulosimicrobium cellulans]
MSVAPRRPRPAAPWYDSPWRTAAAVVATALTVAAVGLVVALAVVPRLAGGAALTVLSGSMEPALAPGDVVVTRGITPRDVCAEVGVGDVVTYLPRPDDPALITHRVVGKTIGTFDDGTGCRLITQGDANTAVDEPVSPEQVRGTLLYGLPRLGWARQWAEQHRPVVFVLAVLVPLGWAVVSSSRRPRTRAVLVPGPLGGPPAAADHPPQGGESREQELRERELVLRERELAVRERELALRAGTRPSSTNEASCAPPA